MQLKSDIRYIQKLSMIQNKEYAISFYQSQSRYTTSVKVGTSYQLASVIYLPDETVKIETNAINSMIIFSKKGITKNGATIILQTKSYKLEMTVFVSTGQVEIKQITKK